VPQLCTSDFICPRFLRFLAAAAGLCGGILHAQQQPSQPDPVKLQEFNNEVGTLNDTLTRSNSVLSVAESFVAELTLLTDPGSNRGDLVMRIQAVNRELTAMQNPDVLKALDDRKADVKGATDALSRLCDKSTLGADDAAKCTKAAADGQSRQDDLDSAKKNLNAILAEVAPFFTAGVNQLIQDLGQVETQWSSPADLSGEAFATSVSTYTKSCSASSSSSALKDTEKLLKPLQVDASASGALDTALSSLNGKLKDDAKKLDAILTAVQKKMDDAKKTVADSITAVAATPVASGDAASKAVVDATKAGRGGEATQDVWPTLETSIKQCEADQSHLAGLRVALEGVKTSRKALQEKLSALNDALAGDPNQFTEEVVQLFYYTEVEKLMRSLNERTDWNGGNSTAATVAASQRELLLDSESRVTQARGDVADLQYELAKLQEQQRQSDAAISQLGLLSQKASVNKQQSGSNLARAADELNQAQAASDADPSNTAKKLQLQKATAKKNEAAAKASDAATKDSDAKTKLSDAQAQQTSANSDKDSLAARIQLAQSKLGGAQQNLEEMQRNAYRAALTESEAFAAARDQTPYLEAPALSTSPDPLKRVIMRGYPDRNLILLRGKREDLAVLKRVISDFDVPAPQARLTMWSFEISAELGKPFLWFKKPADRLNEATALVDETLGLARGLIAEAATNLRESINDAVSQVDVNGLTAETSCSDQLEIPSELYQHLSLSEQARWRRFRFYSPGVLIQAGINMADAQSFRNAVLPDPAATTTIGEALMVLSLSCIKNRSSIFRDFRKRTHSYMGALAKSTSVPPASDPDKTKCPDGPTPCFSGTAQVLQIPIECCPKGTTKAANPSVQNEQMLKGRQDLARREQEFDAARRAFEEQKEALIEPCKKALADCEKKLTTEISPAAGMESCQDPTINPDLGLPDSVEPSLPSVETEGLTDTQLEIVRALRAGAAKQILHEMDGLRDLIASLEKVYRDIRNKPLFPHLAEPDLHTCRLKVAEIKSLYDRCNRLVNTRLRLLYPNEFRDFQLVPDRADFSGRASQQSQQIWKRLTEAGPRVAAADEMLKRMMSRLEDDLDQTYVQPMLRDVRSKLVKKGLTVGIVQRTSVLATNRLKVRVDPKGMYDLGVGEQQDLLASIGQLASIYMSAQTGGALAALGSLNSQNQKQEQRIYGITTGSKFEVTPIFDPSGQALRFKFDYVSNSLVRNPKGTIDPSMPSIRHTINTEVQLSNLEIREVSRYESNAKLGIPTRYYGGIPILTDIPGLKPIPLIGWFVRRAGSNAEAQQSIIFGQTTIYPEIGSIVNLLQTGN
jgi:hypothetical protein